MSNLAREPLQIVEIDVDKCTLSYGVAPCTASGASGSECFNSFFTCQDPTNYDRGTLTLRFSGNRYTGIKTETIFPALMSVSTNPTRIALGKTDERLGSLGQRARVSVNLMDFTWGDQITDPYVTTRSYDPKAQGTFFGKLRARNPYYYGRALRVRNGYVGDTIATMPTRHYIITEWIGPDSDGNVTITAQDPLKLADAEFAVCPRPSTGRLGVDINAAFTGTVAFEVAGSGSAYAASGKIAIGSEIMSYSAVTANDITISERATDGTEASSHSAGDTVQECYVADDALPYDTIEDLLLNYAEVSASFLPTADWTSEISRWLPTLRFNRVIPKPTPVRDLLAQIGDFGIVFWWDEVAQEIKVRANRPDDLGETITDLTDTSAILERTTSREDLDEQRLSRVLVWHAYLSAIENMTEGKNYKRLPIRVDVDAESADEYGQIRELQIFLPWLGPNGDDTLAQNIGIRMLRRYRDTPQRLTFHLDIKDRDNAQVADLVRVTSYTLQDVFGASSPTEMQITSVEEIDPGHVIRVVAESYQFEGRFGFIAPNTTTSGDYSATTRYVFLADKTLLPDPFGDGAGPFLLF